MTSLRVRAAAAALLTLCAVPARAFSVEDQKVIDSGLTALYRCDYDGAEKAFSEAMAARPGDAPMSLGYAVATWWRMENDFAPKGGPEEARFLAAVKTAIADGQRAASRTGDAESYLCLGAAYGLRGRLEATRKQWFKAYGDGRRAYKAEQRAVKLDPGLDDAYLGLGAFDYYTATLSRFIRLFIFTKPDKAKGLAELDKAKRGHFSGMAAQLLLVSIDWTFEKKPREAWDILEELRARFPESPLFETMRLIGLFHLRDGEGLSREAKLFLAKADGGAPFYNTLDKAAGHYFLGLGEQLSGRCEEAIEQDRAALELIPPGHRTRGLPWLFIGECQDILGRRGEAKDSYRQALANPPFWGVPRYAKYLLKHPFRAGENPLPGRNDELE